MNHKTTVRRPVRTPLALAILLAYGNTIAGETTTLAPIAVEGAAESAAPAAATVLDGEALLERQPVTGDTASLLKGVPGVNLNQAGGVSSLPSIHGLADDRVRIKVDGMDLISTCPNHMNPPLSYLDPASVEVLEVYPGVAPVSVGGDSIGGTIAARTAEPAFAAAGEKLTKGNVGARYATNGDALRANLSLTHASETTSLNYSGGWSRSGNYFAGDDFKSFTATGRPGHTLSTDEVGSTAYENFNHALNLAVKGEGRLFDARLGYQNSPYQAFPNQRMDMLDNEQKRVNLGYRQDIARGDVEVRAYYEVVDHYMNFGDDKQLVYGGGVVTSGMHMESYSTNAGATVKSNLELDSGDMLTIGGELQRYRLEDYWPPSGGMMAPGTFQNINDGERDRIAAYVEWETDLGPKLSALLGARYEHVRMDAGDVTGYDNVNGGGSFQLRDSGNDPNDGFIGFNERDHNRNDNNIDLSALATYDYDQTLDIEFGVARKVRSPNLYERYTWSTWVMASVMNNTVGDGNGYVGDIDLDPEKAYTASVSFDWQAPDRSWSLRATPHYTHVDDYIDAIQWDSVNNVPAAANTPNQFNVLKYTNQSARIYGIDVSGDIDLAKNAFGDWRLLGLLNYTNGRNNETGDALYNIMPLNATFTVEQSYAGWSNAVELVMVDEKDYLSDVRNEIETGGYALVNLRASHKWRNFRIDFGVENLFNTGYDLPTGGTYTGQGTTMGINAIPWGIAVPGPGRSLYAGFNLSF